jgi:hypothetical protein
MTFLTILTAPGLSRSHLREAVRAGPPAVLAQRDHHALLRSAGFHGIEEADVTAGYLRTVRAWFDQASAREAQLRAVIGGALFDDRQNDRHAQASAIERGLLRRSLFVAHVA